MKTAEPHRPPTRDQVSAMLMAIADATCLLAHIRNDPTTSDELRARCNAVIDEAGRAVDWVSLPVLSP